jgi:adenosylcobinamide-GDP ribazoletransferase
MRILKSIAVAFSMYSRIPMPRFQWASEDMKYHLAFFPWVGAAIGIAEYLWQLVYFYFGVSDVSHVLIAVALPILITGGFHLDGLMDTADALSSWRTKEERLEILKDPHIGAFSVIRLVLYGLIFTAAVAGLTDDTILIWMGTFFLARCFSGIGVITLKSARNEGLLATEASSSSPKVVRTILVIETVICAGWMMGLCLIPGLITVAIGLATFVYYRYFAYKNFGGVTGDLAGWYLCIAELCMTLGLWLTEILGIFA